MQTAKGEIALAESDRKRAEDRLAWSNHMIEIKGISEAQNIADRLSFQKSDFSFEQGQAKLKVLVEFTRAKTVMELTNQVEVAKSRDTPDERPMSSNWPSGRSC